MNGLYLNSLELQYNQIFMLATAVLMQENIFE